MDQYSNLWNIDTKMAYIFCTPILYWSRFQWWSRLHPGIGSGSGSRKFGIVTSLVWGYGSHACRVCGLPNTKIICCSAAEKGVAGWGWIAGARARRRWRTISSSSPSSRYYKLSLERPWMPLRELRNSVSFELFSSLASYDESSPIFGFISQV